MITHESTFRIIVPLWGFSHTSHIFLGFGGFSVVCWNNELQSYKMPSYAKFDNCDTMTKLY